MRRVCIGLTPTALTGAAEAFGVGCQLGCRCLLLANYSFRGKIHVSY